MTVGAFLPPAQLLRSRATRPERAVKQPQENWTQSWAHRPPRRPTPYRGPCEPGRRISLGNKVERPSVRPTP